MFWLQASYTRRQQLLQQAELTVTTATAKCHPHISQTVSRQSIFVVNCMYWLELIKFDVSNTSSSSRVGFISGTIFTGQMTQPTVSSTEGQHLVSPPGKGAISPDQALILP